MPNFGYINTIRQTLISEILTNIQTSGLHGSTDERRLRSNDNDHISSVCFNSVDLTGASSNSLLNYSSSSLQSSNPYSFMPGLSLASLLDSPDVLESLVHNVPDGIWSILHEREQFVANGDRIESEERIQNGVVFIWENEEPPNRWQSVQEVVTNSIPSTAFQAIIAPKALESIIAPIFPGLKIVYVDNICRNQNVNSRPGLESKRFYINGPNFKEGIHQAISELNLTKFSCHATRLPTRRDVIRLYSSRLSKEELCQHYGCESDAAKAIRRIAAGYGHREDIEFLHQIGIAPALFSDPDQVAGKMKTALHWAVNSKDLNKPMIRALLRAGASIEIKDAQEQTPQDIALSKGIDLSTINSRAHIAEEEKQIFIAQAQADLRREGREAMAKLGVGRYYRYSEGL